MGISVNNVNFTSKV